MSENSPLAPEMSPLAEADPASLNELVKTRINELFNKPPLSVSDDDLRIMVEYYRKDRARFVLESQVKVPRAVANRTKAAKPAPQSVADALAAMKEASDLL